LTGIQEAAVHEVHILQRMWIFCQVRKVHTGTSVGMSTPGNTGIHQSSALSMISSEPLTDFREHNVPVWLLG